MRGGLIAARTSKAILKDTLGKRFFASASCMALALEPQVLHLVYPAVLEVRFVHAANGSAAAF